MMRGSRKAVTVFVILVAVLVAWPALAQEYVTIAQASTPSYWPGLPYLGIIWSRPRFDVTLAVRVEGVFPNSPADAAGIQKGDYIVAIQKGFDFFLPHQLADYCRAGDTVLVVLKRKTGTEPWWTYSTLGRYVRLGTRPNRPLQEGEV